jgi:hypothetical protein
MCNVSNIPAHLHWADESGNLKPTINRFFKDEELYWRCPKEPNKPVFPKDIKLADISVNRQGDPNQAISQPEDVLLNSTNGTKFTDKDIMILQINNILAIPEDLHSFINENRINFHLYIGYVIDANKNVTFDTTCNHVLIGLVHDPIECNYAHSMFLFYHNGIKITFQNFDQSLGNKQNKTLRGNCRDVLRKFIKRTLIT